MSHIWFFRGIPSRIGLILDITPRLSACSISPAIVTDPGDTPLKKQPLTEKEYREFYEKYETTWRQMGADIKAACRD